MKCNALVHWTVLGAALIVALGCARRLGDVPRSGEAQSQPARGPAADAGIGFGKRIIVGHRGAMTRTVLFSEGEKGVDVLTTEGNAGTVYRSQNSLTTSFQVSAVASRHPDEIYVAGYDDATGEVVIERWRGTAPTGAMQGAMYESPNGIGTPCDLHWPSVTIVGGTFVPPAQRPNQLPPARVAVYRGTALSGVAGMSIDPEGRFLLAQDSLTGDILQVTATGAPTTVVSAATFPGAATATLAPPYQNAFDDRVYAFMIEVARPAPRKVLVLHDAENDGLFESVGVMTYSAFLQAYPTEETGGAYQGMR